VTYIPEDPEHKNYLIGIQEQLLEQQKITNYLLAQMLGMEDHDLEGILDDEDL